MIDLLFIIFLAIAAYQDFTKKKIADWVCASIWLSILLAPEIASLAAIIFAVCFSLSVFLARAGIPKIGWADILIFPIFLAFSWKLKYSFIILAFSMFLMWAYIKVRKEKETHLIPFLALAYAIIKLINLTV